jgi:hypothetical protein
MKKLEYSPLVIRKLKNLKSLLTDNYGKEHAHRIIVTVQHPMKS